MVESKSLGLTNIFFFEILVPYDIITRNVAEEKWPKMQLTICS